MKKIIRFGLLVAFLAISAWGFPQSTIDFETVGDNWTWTSFNNGVGGADDLTAVTCPAANPATTGINTSAYCLKFIDAPTAAPWGGFFSTNVGTVTVTEATKIFKVMVYKDKLSRFGVKLEGGTIGALEVLVTNTKTNEWEELTFDFSAKIGQTFNKLVFLPDFNEPRTSGGAIYIDNVIIPTIVPPVAASEPTTVPIAPTHPIANVISIYGIDTYTPVTGVDPLADWGQFGRAGSTYEYYTISGTSHNVLKYGKLSFQGIDFTGNPQDLTAMKYLHLDIWTGDAAATPLWVALIHLNENIALIKTITTDGTWYGLDIPLAEYVGSTLTSINQLMFTSDEWRTLATNTSLPRDIYVDNIYFWSDVTPTLTVSPKTLTIASLAGSTNSFGISSSINWTVSSDQTWLTPSAVSGTANGTITLSATANTVLASRTATVTITGSDATIQTVVITQTGSPVPDAPTPTIAALGVIAIFSDTYTPVAAEFQNWSGTNMTEQSSATPANKVKNVSANCCFGYGLTVKDISSMTTMHVDIYPTTLASMSIGIVSNGDKKVAKTLTPNVWNSIDIPLADFTGANLANVAQIGFWDMNGVFYMDNLYFYNATVGLSKLDKSDISVYPNPVKSDLFLNGLPQNATVKIYDMRGKLIINRQNGDNQIHVNNLAKGIYSIQISGKNGITTKKFVKE